MENIYYVYTYNREDGTPYYVGKGKGRRAYTSHRSVHVPKDRSRIVFLYENMTEAEAHAKEIELIALYGRKDNGTGILRNLTDGGEGTSGAIVSEETKAKRSAALKGKLTGEKNPFYGKTHSDETKKRLSQIHLGKVYKTEEQIKQWVETVAKKPKSEEHKKNILQASQALMDAMTKAKADDFITQLQFGEDAFRRIIIVNFILVKQF